MPIQKSKKALGLIPLFFILNEMLYANEIVQPRKEMQVCNQKDDCEKIEISCSHCCKTGAINKEFLLQYSQEKLLKCKGYQGKFCNCVAVPVSLECIQSKCRIKSPIKTP